MISTTHHTRLVFNTKRDFGHTNPELFIKHDYTEMSIYALYDAESWNRLHLCTTKGHPIYSTLTQKLVEEAKLRVHDQPLKTTAKLLVTYSGASTSVRRVRWWATSTALAQG
jgi:hypothetical protein